MFLTLLFMNYSFNQTIMHLVGEITFILTLNEVHVAMENAGWKAHLVGSYKLNVDVAFEQNSEGEATTMVLRDSN